MKSPYCVKCSFSFFFLCEVNEREQMHNGRIMSVCPLICFISKIIKHADEIWYLCVNKQLPTKYYLSVSTQNRCYEAKTQLSSN